jgi:hypothetical protein
MSNKDMVEAVGGLCSIVCILLLAGMLGYTLMDGGDANKNNEPDIKAVEIDDIRQYKFTDKQNNVEYVITDKPDGVSVKRKNIE